MAAVVIGVSNVPGIGYAVAKKFASQGLKVREMLQLTPALLLLYVFCRCNCIPLEGSVQGLVDIRLDIEYFTKRSRLIPSQYVVNFPRYVTCFRWELSDDKNRSWNQPSLH